MKKTRNEIKRIIKKRIEIRQNQHAFIDSKKNEIKMSDDITRPDIRLSNDERTKLRGGNFSNAQIPKKTLKTFTQLPNCPLECIITRQIIYNPFEGVRTMVLSNYQNQFKYNNILVILGYNIEFNILKYQEKYPNYKIVIYQLEQLYDNKSQWYNINSKNGEVVNRTKHIQKSLSECDEIWDYDLDNINFLKAEGFNNIIHVPLEYTPDLIRVNNITTPKYELLFFGSINDRRAKILSLLCNKYNIYILAPEVDCNKYKNHNFGKCMSPSVFGNNLYNYVFNSKIIINLHYYESYLQEQVRLFELLINNSIIVSEKSIRNYFGDLLYEFDGENDMFKKIDLILKNDMWKNNNISERFKNKEYKRFKVGAAYNTFYGLELIEESIKSIKKYVDYIIIVHQKIGFNGNPEPEKNKQILKNLIDNKLVDDIVYYDGNKDIEQGVLNKRNIGLDYCKKNGCTFIMPMDSDERYNIKELITEINFMYDNNIDTLYSPIYSYYYDENHYFKDTYFVASVFKIDNRRFEVTKSSVLVDPLRKMNEGIYKISEMYMHHYTYLKNSFSNKINNSVALTTDDSYITIGMKKIYDYLMLWSEGNEAFVFANDIKNGGIILTKVKLLKK
jgi:hypothetical protein